MSEARSEAKQKWLLPLVLLAVGLAVGAGLAFAWQKALPAPEAATSVEALYAAAVRDSVFAEEDELYPLVCLTKDDSRVTWNEAGDRVLLLTWHKYPDSYPVGQTVTLEWGPIWTFTDVEILERYAAEPASVADWPMRLRQLIGLPPDAKHSTFSGVWVRPEDVLRPAYQTDPTANGMSVRFAEDVDAEFKAWFDGNIIWSYFDSAYPWTRLGYTYDWSGGESEYGLTEFLVRQGAQVQVAFTEPTDAFLERLAEGGAESAVAPAA